MHSEGIEIMLPEYLPPFMHKDTCGEGLVKLTVYSDVTGRWVDGWRSGTFPEKPQVSEGSTVCNHRSCSD